MKKVKIMLAYTGICATIIEERGKDDMQEIIKELISLITATISLITAVILLHHTNSEKSKGKE